MMRVAGWVFILVCIVSLGAAAAEIRPSSEPVSSSTEPVLTVVDSTGESTELSLQAIESVGLYEAEFEHFEGVEGRFTGVRLNELLAELGMADTEQVRLLALDGYSTFLSASERSEWVYLMATRLDGDPIPVSEMGPLMLVIPERAEQVLAGKAPMTEWIWAVTTLQAMP